MCSHRQLEVWHRRTDRATLAGQSRRVATRQLPTWMTAEGENRASHRRAGGRRGILGTQRWGRGSTGRQPQWRQSRQMSGERKAESRNEALFQSSCLLCVSGALEITPLERATLRYLPLPQWRRAQGGYFRERSRLWGFMFGQPSAAGCRGPKFYYVIIVAAGGAGCGAGVCGTGHVAHLGSQLD